MADLYPDEEGYICDGNVIAFCKLAGTTALHEGVKFGTTDASGVISVLAGTAFGDCNAVALKAGVTGEFVPVCFYGVVKMLAGDTLTAGDILKSGTTAQYVLPIDTFTHDQFSLWRGLCGETTGTIFRLGMALQEGAVYGDDLLVLIGRIA